MQTSAVPAILFIEGDFLDLKKELTDDYASAVLEIDVQESRKLKIILLNAISSPGYHDVFTYLKCHRCVFSKNCFKIFSATVAEYHKNLGHIYKKLVP